jgi:hypothetical protein
MATRKAPQIPDTLGEAIDRWEPDELDDISTHSGGQAGKAGPEINLTDPQWSVYCDPARFRVLVAGRRFGKTYLAVPELLRIADGPDRLAWYLSPTYRQAKDDLWRPLKRIARPYIIGKPNETDLSIDLINGGRIALRSADNYDSLRGAGLNGCVIDEYADIAPEAWTEALRPMLSDRLGRALFIGTPEGYNHFYDLYNEAKSGKPGWSAYQYTTAEGGNVAPEEIEAAKHDLDIKTFRQEYEASFETIGTGRAYYAFERDGNVKTQEFDVRLPLCWSLDFNVDPMCSVLCQVDGAHLRVLDEIILPDSNTQESARVFEARAEEYHKRVGGRLRVQVYGDASGAQRQHAGPADWRVIRDSLSRISDRFASNFNLFASNPVVKDRIASVNAMLCNHAGERRVAIDPKCKDLIADLERVVWKRDSAGNARDVLDDSNKKLTHVSDAFGYLVWSEFGLRLHGGPRSTYIGV